MRRFARILRNAHIAAYIEDNTFHDNPGWDELNELSRASYEAFARHLLKAGVTPPCQ